ncbi:MAG: hypothetical protein HKN97_15215 [Myxococcales bacterium]|nr:hypothetical protein [Deltaproteobacteria bacterium]NND29930.1 hypothetical protein [Myxococcales bacterium]
MKRVLVCVLVWTGCAHPSVVAESSAVEPDVSAWTDQIGSILTPARACVDKHPEPGATIVGVRTLATGETSIMTRSTTEGVVACVHDGRAVVYQARVELADQEVAELPFVMLEGGAPPVNGTCMSVRELYWGSRFVGWVGEPTCTTNEAEHGPR